MWAGYEIRFLKLLYYLSSEKRVGFVPLYANLKSENICIQVSVGLVCYKLTNTRNMDTKKFVFNVAILTNSIFPNFKFTRVGTPHRVERFYFDFRCR